MRFSPGDRSRPAEQRSPRLWFDCMVTATPACARTQSIACSTDYRLLVPLWRTDSLYHELKASHGTHEAAHDWWRDRYKVAADDLGLRPKVRDLGFHRLRANVASLIEWLRICHCQGWLGSPKRNHRETKRRFRDRAERIQAKLATMRVRMGVAAPYGVKAGSCSSASARRRHGGRVARRQARPCSTSQTPDRALSTPPTTS